MAAAADPDINQPACVPSNTRGAPKDFDGGIGFEQQPPSWAAHENNVTRRLSLGL